MKFLLVSDCHLEFFEDKGKSFVQSLSTDQSDVIVIAGDFETNDIAMLRLSEVCEKFREVIFVCGNHSYYGANRGKVNATLKKVEQKYPNFHWLNCSSVIVDGQRFLGCTNWWETTAQTAFRKDMINDFRCIEAYSKWVGPTAQKHREYLEANVLSTDVVVTHYLPLWACVDDDFVGDPSNCFYVKDMSKLINDVQPKAWLHGHSHVAMDKMFGNTRVIRNPKGYPKQNPLWEPMLIEIK